MRRGTPPPPSRRPRRGRSIRSVATRCRRRAWACPRLISRRRPRRGAASPSFSTQPTPSDNRHQAQTSASSASFPKRIEERKATALDAFLASKTKDPERREATEAGGEAGEAHGGYGAKEKGEALGEDGAEEKEEEGDAAFVTCARCGETHAAGRDAQEHADYHVALDLSRETTFSSAAVERPVVVGGAGGRR